MKTLLLFDPDTNELTEITRSSPLSSIEGVISHTLTIYDLIGNRSMGWLDMRLLKAFEAFEQDLGIQLDITCAYSKTGGFSHGSGLALHMRSSLMSVEDLRVSAVRSGLFSYIEPPSLSPAWVHAELYCRPMPCLFKGQRGTHVMLLNDVLDLPASPLFSSVTEARLKRFQKTRGLRETGVTDNITWNFVKLGSD